MPSLLRYVSRRMVDADSRRPTRWQKAWADTQLLRWKREAISAVVVGVLSLGLLKALGSDDGVKDELIVVAVSVGAVLVLMPLAELVWNWLQAPMRLLTDDVLTVQRQIAELPRLVQAPQAEPQTSLRTTVLDQIRWGRELLELSTKTGYPIRPDVAVQWTNTVVTRLKSHGADATVQRFLEATADAGDKGVRARIAELEAIAGELRG